MKKELDKVIKQELRHMYGYLLLDIYTAASAGTSHHLEEGETVAFVLLSVLKKGGAVPPETCLPFNAEVNAIIRHLKNDGKAVTGRAIAHEWRRTYESAERVLYLPVFRGIVLK